MYIVKSWAKIIDLVHWGSSVRVVVAVEDRNFSWVAGQWIDFAVQLNNERKVAGYSICSPTGTGGPIELLVRESSHPVSQWLHHLAKVGDRVLIQGGSGTCVYHPKENDKVVLIAGGIGITPVISMIRTAALTAFPLQMHLFYSSTHRQDIHFHQELQALDERFVVDIRCTGEGDSRFTAEEIIARCGTTARFYIMGPKAMMDAFSNDLRERSISLHLERWW